MIDRKLLFGRILFLVTLSCGPGESSPPGETVVLDLACELVRCEVVRSTPEIVLGTERAKHFLVEADLRDHDEARGWYSVAARPGTPAFAYLLTEGAIDLPLYGRGKAVLEIEGAVPIEREGEARLEITVNDHSAGTLGLPRGAKPAVARLPLDDDWLVAGQNRIVLSAPPEVSLDVGLPFHVRVSAAILRVTISTRAHGPVAEPAAAAGTIHQPAGTALRFFHEVRAGDELVVSAQAARTDEPLPAKVLVKWEDREPLPAARLALPPDGEAIERRIVLTPPPGSGGAAPCAITLEAGRLGSPRAGAFVLWNQARIERKPPAASQTAPPGRPETGQPGDRVGRGHPPSVLLILLDAAAAGHIGCYGGRQGVTPHIDDLAAQGVRFADVVTPAPFTLPSVGSLFTSLSPDRHGVTSSAGAGHGLALDPELPTLAARLQDAGYRTGAVVTNPNAAALYGYAKGFGFYDELFADKTLWNEGVRPEATVQAALESIDRLTGTDPGTPFFLYVHFFPPHAPYRPPPELARRFTGAYTGPADGSVQLITGFADTGRPHLAPEDFAHLADLYDANLSYADRSVGALLDGLDERGLDDKTVVILCADHGEAFGRHASLGHGHHLYEQTTHVPLIVRYPDRHDAGRSITERASLLDIAPSILGLAGIPRSDRMEGVDLLSSRASPPDTRLLVLRSDVFKPSYALVQGPYKYIVDTLSRRRELYDLEQDPGEMDNLADRLPVRSSTMHSHLCRLLCAMLEDQTVVSVTPSREIVRSLEAIGYAGSTSKQERAKRCPLLRFPRQP